MTGKCNLYLTSSLQAWEKRDVHCYLGNRHTSTTASQNSGPISTQTCFQCDGVDIIQDRAAQPHMYQYLQEAHLYTSADWKYKIMLFWGCLTPQRKKTTRRVCMCSDALQSVTICGSNLSRERGKGELQQDADRGTDKDRRADGQRDGLADVLEWVLAGEASVCFCVEITQTPHSDHHTHWVDSAYTILQTCCVGDWHNTDWLTLRGGI